MNTTKTSKSKNTVYLVQILALGPDGLIPEDARWQTVPRQFASRVAASDWIKSELRPGSGPSCTYRWVEVAAEHADVLTRGAR
jgi:hypothetical protein